MKLSVRLPNPPHRTAVRCFWIALAALGTVVATSILWLADGPVRVGLIPLALLIPAWMRPDTTRAVYRFWNRAAAWYGHRAAAWVSRVAYHVVLRAAGRGMAEDLLRLPSGAGSGWSARLPGDPGLEDPWVAGAFGRRGSWIRRYVRWSVRSGRPLLLILLPYLFLLRALDVRIHEELPDHMYTLY